MFKFFFLINPISGGGQGKIIYDYLPEIMQSMNFKESEWKAEFTDIKNLDAQICNVLNDTETLIAVGGDGTVSAVLSAMISFERKKSVTIGLIPLGTGNDLARVLNLYKPYVDKGLLFLVRRLLLARASLFDIWKVNGKIALANYFSGGIDARIAHDFNKDRATGAFKSKSVIANKLHYVKRFFADRKYRLKSGELEYITENDVSEYKNLAGTRTVIVGNIPSFASGANPFYKSNMADKLLEIVCVPNMVKFLLAIAIGSVPILGNFIKRHFVVTLKAKSITLKFSENEFLQLDGEDLSGKLGCNVTIEHACQVKMLSLGK